MSMEVSSLAIDESVSEVFPPAQLQETLTVPLIKMILIPGGSFQMGSDDQVSLKNFYIGETEVTQGQYRHIMGANPSNPRYGSGDNIPVSLVSWYDAIVFCNMLSLEEGLTPVYTLNGNTDPNRWGDVPTEENNDQWNEVTMNQSANGYRLPTEAEWEYAARGGSKSNGYRYAGSDNVDDVGWYENNSDGQNHPVAQKQANELGLYDMSGNVWAWCWDRYTGGYSFKRVMRGGSWYNSSGYLRITKPGWAPPGSRGSNIGLRLVRSSP